MAGKEGDKKPPAPPVKAPAAAPAAPKKPASSFDQGGGLKTANQRKPPPPVPTGKVEALNKSPGVARPAAPPMKPRPFDTLDSEVTSPGGPRLPSLSDVRKLTGSTAPSLKPVPEKMLTPFTSAQPAVLVKPPTVLQKHMQNSGFDDDEKTNTDMVLGNVAGLKLDADEEDEITVTTVLHDGMLPAKEVTSVDTWKAVNAPMQSKVGRRSAMLYQNVIDQFAVAYNQRYQMDESQKPKTHIFVWDVTRAMNCEVPHFAGGRETTLGQMVDWLRFEGHTRGWKKATAEQAAAAADEGMAVLALPQEGKLRYLAVVRPGGLDANGFPRVAAAVDEVGNDMPAPEALKTRLITYYVHD